jgi:hypothetical protein
MDKENPTRPLTLNKDTVSFGLIKFDKIKAFVSVLYSMTFEYCIKCEYCSTNSFFGE